jgi:hypothetical protein
MSTEIDFRDSAEVGIFIGISLFLREFHGISRNSACKIPRHFSLGKKVHGILEEILILHDYVNKHVNKHEHVDVKIVKRINMKMLLYLHVRVHKHENRHGGGYRN